MSKRPKRPSLVQQVSEAAEQADTQPPAGREAEPYVSSTFHMPQRLLTKLRGAAACEAARRGRGRPSASAVLVELLERHESELDDMTKP